MALIAAHLNAGHFGGDSVAIGIFSLSLFPHLHTHFPLFSPSLISFMVSVDVKHHVYLPVPKHGSMLLYVHRNRKAH